MLPIQQFSRILYMFILRINVQLQTQDFNLKFLLIWSIPQGYEIFPHPRPATSLFMYHPNIVLDLYIK